MDALLAFAFATFVISVIFVLLPPLSAQQSTRLNRLHAAEFAFSVLEEYRVTFPVMSAKGEDASGWAWSVSERTVSPNPPGTLDASLAYVEVTATVWQRGWPAERHIATTLVARRLP